MTVLLAALAVLVPGAAVGVVVLIFAMYALAVEYGTPTSTQLLAVGICVFALPGTVLLGSVLLDRFCGEQAPPTALRRLGSVAGLVMVFAIVPLPQILEMTLTSHSLAATVTQLLRLSGQVIAAAGITAAILQLTWAAPTLVFAWLARREPLASSALIGLRALRPLVLLAVVAFTSQHLLAFLQHEVGPQVVRTSLEGG